MATRPVRGPQARRVGSVRCHGAPSGGEGHADGASEGCAKVKSGVFQPDCQPDRVPDVAL
ncbi:hypothetical protein RR48_13696 [Papilio machaon]|uniref:Uncharacterized protein n=1 Tax=Papilio machaon TaxID=76193 RepID=A0A194RHN7_PAPMA|nr:hypothetical protein RR48_13696 [Papilio machaon]